MTPYVALDDVCLVKNDRCHLSLKTDYNHLEKNEFFHKELSRIRQKRVFFTTNQLGVVFFQKNVAKTFLYDLYSLLHDFLTNNLCGRVYK